MPQRSWEEIIDEGTGEVVRWNLFENEQPIEGAYLLKLENGKYEMHFPRLVTDSIDDFEFAKQTLENAPLTKHGGIVVGREAEETDMEDFYTSQEAADALGISRPRINAMVANGVLAGKRVNGKILVSKAAVAKRLAGGEVTGPQGRFANTFLQFFPDRNVNEFYLAEIDAQNETQVQQADALVEAVTRNEAHPAAARVVDYRHGMKLRSSSHRMNGTGAIDGFKSFIKANRALIDEATTAPEPEAEAAEAGQATAD